MLQINIQAMLIHTTHAYREYKDNHAKYSAGNKGEEKELYNLVVHLHYYCPFSSILPLSFAKLRMLAHPQATI